MVASGESQRRSQTVVGDVVTGVWVAGVDDAALLGPVDEGGRRVRLDPAPDRRVRDAQRQVLDGRCEAGDLRVVTVTVLCMVSGEHSWWRLDLRVRADNVGARYVYVIVEYLMNALCLGTCIMHWYLKVLS